MLPTYLQNILFRLSKYPIRRPIYVASFFTNNFVQFYNNDMFRVHVRC